MYIVMTPQTEFTLTEYPNKNVEFLWSQDWITDNSLKSRYLHYSDSKNSKGGVEILYKKKPYGRAYPSKLNATYMERGIRATLFADKYWDIDIVCCHQSIICNLCKKYKLSKPKFR